MVAVRRVLAMTVIRSKYKIVTARPLTMSLITRWSVRALFVLGTFSISNCCNCLNAEMYLKTYLVVDNRAKTETCEQ